MTISEYRVLLKYLREFYEYWMIFDWADQDRDRRIHWEEFEATEDAMSSWGIDTSDMRGLF